MHLLPAAAHVCMGGNFYLYKPAREAFSRAARAVPLYINTPVLVLIPGTASSHDLQNTVAALCSHKVLHDELRCVTEPVRADLPYLDLG